MIDFIEYVVKELKSKRLSKANALSLVEQFAQNKNARQVTPVIHPLLHQNTSDLNEQKYSSIFDGNEFFLRDHQVRDVQNLNDDNAKQKILPGVAYLEMALAAIDSALPVEKDISAIELRNIIWAYPIIVSDKKQVDIALLIDSENSLEQIDYEIFSELDGQDVIHCQGQAVYIHESTEKVCDIDKLKAQMSSESIPASDFYSAFESMGLFYGPAHQGIVEAFKGENQLLAKIKLPDVLISEKDKYRLNPSLLDSALQSSLGLVDNINSGSYQASVPFALESLRIFNKLSYLVYVWVRYSDDSSAQDKVTKLDIDLCDANGGVCVQLRGFTSRELTPPTKSIDVEKNQVRDLIATYQWTEDKALVNRADQAQKFHKHHILSSTSIGIELEDISAQFSCAICSTLEVNSDDVVASFQTAALKLFHLIQTTIQETPKEKCLFQIIIADEQNNLMLLGLTGLLKTAALENPNVMGQIIVVPAAISVKKVCTLLQNEKVGLVEPIVKYCDSVRSTLSWTEKESEQSTSNESDLVLKEDGVYLITGGLGGVGQVFAKHIINQTKDAKVIITGRGEVDGTKQKILDSISTDKKRLAYSQLDLCDLEQVKKVTQGIDSQYSKLNGILHCAGYNVDSFILKKSEQEFKDVLAPKVIGSVNLDKATQSIDLDFLALFSSSVAVFGNLGQADYAAANGFMDQFSTYRNSLQASKQRFGKTVSINWSLWQEGGMKVQDDALEILRYSTGLSPMKSETGIALFNRCLRLQQSQFLVAEGDIEKFKSVLLNDRQKVKAVSSDESIVNTIDEVSAAQVSTEQSTTNSKDSTPDTNTLLESTQNFLKDEFSLLVKISSHKINPASPLEEYGINSILAMNFTSQLERTFGSLSKTLLFEYQSIHDLSNYFIQSHIDTLNSLFELSEEKEIASVKPKAKIASSNKPAKPSSIVAKPRRVSRQRFSANQQFTSDLISSVTAKQNSQMEQSIAIVGLSGRYPQAKNIDEYWQNLKQGKDCVEEVPQDRWRWQDYYSDDRMEEGRHYSKWGGFIEGVDEFDPRFFNISPREAFYIDPQERLFLQHTWMAIEDAGYTRATLHLPRKGLSGQVGVYTGVMYGEYNLSGSLASIANRVSYFLNLHGPSMTLDTMCSSSLTAVHLACQDLRYGVTDLGIAGGVNVSISPSKYTILSAGQFISSKGVCQSFGEGGDGYIPGEGVGVAVLKRLSEAERDGNLIYAVIKGSSLNHGGKTNGYTVPNPQAQAAVISDALKQAKVDPQRVSYIEAHGTGTQLGDPIEIAALSKAFTQEGASRKRKFGNCLIGSAKSNIGHCESAAGIAGLTKILLQMKYQKVVPSLHSETLNPHIDFDSTPFLVNQELTNWETAEENGKALPRIAGLSSFGAGGSNAHIVLQEYLQPESVGEENTPVAIVLSARTKSQLAQKAAEFLNFVRIESERCDLESIAYTLQIGRESMAERLAVVVSSRQQLVEKLTSYTESDDWQQLDDIFEGQASNELDPFAFVSDDNDFQETIEKWFAQKKLAKLANFWVKGVELDWSKLYSERKITQSSLPAYPFAREKYWADTINSGPLAVHKPNKPIVEDKVLHPLLHTNISDFSKQSYQSVFTGDENFFIEQSQTGMEAPNQDLISQSYLSPLAYLEMAREAVIRSIPNSKNDQVLQLTKVVWGVPFVAKSLNPLRIELDFLDDNSHVDFDILSGTEENDQTQADASDTENVHCQGSARLTSESQTSSVHVTQIRAELAKLKTQSKEGVHSDKILENCFIDKQQLVAEIKYQKNDEANADSNGKITSFLIHPSIQTGINEALSIYANHSESSQQYMPLSIDSIRFFSRFEQDTSIWVQIVESSQDNFDNKKASHNSIDLVLFKESGEICVQLLGLQLIEINVSDVAQIDSQSNTYDSISNESRFVEQNIDKPETINLLVKQPISERAYKKQVIAKPKGVQLLQSNITTKPIIETSKVQPPQTQLQPPQVQLSKMVHSEQRVSTDKTVSKQLSSKKTIASLQAELKQSLADALYLTIDDIDSRSSFIDLGLDSIVGVEWVNSINKQYGLKISATRVYDYSNVVELSQFLNKEIESTIGTGDNSSSQDLSMTEEVAVESIFIEDNVDISEPVVQETELSLEQLKQKLKSSLAEALYLDVEEIEEEKSFIDLGLDSIVGVEWVNSINKRLGLSISATRVYDYSNINQLSQFVSEELANLAPQQKSLGLAPSSVESKISVTRVNEAGAVLDHQSSLELASAKRIVRLQSSDTKVQFPLLKRQNGNRNNRFQSRANESNDSYQSEQKREKIAIVGMSGRYPEAADLDDYWSNLEKGKNSVIEIPASRWDVNQYFDPNPNKKGKIYSKWLGMLEDVEYFDPLFFQISPAEAESMDPQHRLFMQEAYKAFEDSGYSNESLSNKKCGAYLGIMSSDYSLLLAKDTSGNVDTTANSFAIGAARIAYYLNLKGPAIPIDTACSSSLVTIHLASQALLNGEIDMALAGGVSLYLTSDSYLGMCQAGMLSPDGQCKTFDNTANGFVPGEGVGAVILKRLSDAEKDHDYIHGVILGSAINQDGKTNGITAPSVNSQIELERELYTKFDIDPESISYVETHGTGTKLGDPIELEALGTVFSEKTDKKNYCALGSVKSNIGHTSGAAGVASVHKVLLSMRYGTIAPSLHVENENTLFDFDDSPFYIAKQKQVWQASKGTHRRAAVSSFGFSGTNAHLVIEEYKATGREQNASIEQPLSETVIIPISARTEKQLEQKLSDMFDYIQRDLNSVKSTSRTKLQDLAFTLQVGRSAKKHRIVFVVSSLQQFAQKLSDHLIINLESKSDFPNAKKEQMADDEKLADIESCLDKWFALRDFDKLADAWKRGFDLDWNKLYADETPNRISLPTYPFAKQKYWVSLQSDSPLVENQESAILSNRELQEENKKLLFVPYWKPLELSKDSQTLDNDEMLLVIGSDIELYNRVRTSRKKNITIWLNTGSDNKLTKNDDSILDFSGKKDIAELLLQLNLEEQSGLKIIYQLNGELSFEGAYSTQQGDVAIKPVVQDVLVLFSLCQSLMKQKFQRPVKILSLHSTCHSFSDALCNGMAGFLKSLMLENPKYTAKQVSIYEKQQAEESISYSLAIEELNEDKWNDSEVRYLFSNTAKTHQRSTKQFVEKSFSKNTEIDVPLKQGGTYIISGGLGGLGYLFSEYLVTNYHVNLVLFGRSKLTQEKQRRIDTLGKKKSKVIYMQCDVEKLEDVARVFVSAKNKFGKINGVLHSAGVNRDSFILNKFEEEFEAVTKSKISGAINLDLVSKSEDLDWFIMFSSVSGAMGNLGQSDYAYANNFMDSFAEVREAMRQKELRFGQTLSINWPLWETGGMSLSQDDIEMTELKTGMVPMPTSVGLQFWQELLSSAETQGLTLYGRPSKLREYVQAKPSKTLKTTNEISSALESISQEDLVVKTEGYIKRVISDEIKLDVDLIDSNERLEVYGVDSIVIGRFNVSLNHDLGELPKTLLYEYETIEELVEYLVIEAKQALLGYFSRTGVSADNSLLSAEMSNINASETAIQSKAAQVAIDTRSTAQDTIDEPIAIVGLHGYYPQSGDIESYWDKIKQGDDLTELVPQNRWNYNEFYDADPESAVDGKIYCKWGGFLDNFDKFDPEFFNLTPQEAKVIDPQERLFMQSVWSTFEDAGYTRDSLKHYFPKNKSASVGVFVGVTTNTYHLLAPEEWSKGNAVTPSALPWSIANRISYYFDFNGPSMPVDTACSSSLVAIHLACESLKKQECEVAIAGGVNLYLHHSKYQSLCSRQMLSSHGKNCSFGAGDDGFVPGEGVGSLLLKPISQAISHNDHIYAVVKGSDFNHSGRSNGYSAPNPNSQTNLIAAVLSKARVHPETISYIEGHGTGTQLGDSLEILGLSNAFRKQTKNKQYCPIGSVKANIGHSESAAGIAGVSKILMQLKYHKLAPSIHCDKINPNIDFGNTPFYPVRELSDWNSPSGVPRRALINSLGAGGVNACVILEEFVKTEKESVVNVWEQNQLGCLIPLSARNEQDLVRVVDSLVLSIEKNSDVNLGDLAFTLQVGRESFAQRLAILASDVNELKTLLNGWLESSNKADVDSQKVLSGKMDSNKKVSRTKQKKIEEKLDALVSEQDLMGIGGLWVSGASIDWLKMYTSGSPNRISLPTYPFTEKRCWISESKSNNVAKTEVENVNRLHPLLSYNSSTLRGVSFTSVLSNKEFYAVDHKVDSEAIFPGAGFLEMACIAGNTAAERKVSKITDVVWAYPLSFKDGPKVSQIFLKSIGEGTEFEVVSLNDDCERTVHSEGRLFFDGTSDTAFESHVPIQPLIKQSTIQLDAVSFYRKFNQSGFDYGESFRTVKEFYANDTIAVSKLELSEHLTATFDQYILHPSIVDGALQTVAGLMESVDSDTPYLPFALDELELIRPLSKTCYALVEFADVDNTAQAGIRKFTVQIVNSNGDCLVRMKNFYVRALIKQQSEQSKNIEGYDLVE